MKVPLDVVSLESCNQIYAKAGVVLQNGQICAIGVTGAEDACIGNSGGTLMDIDDDTDPFLPYYYLTGLFSFGPTPCRKFKLLCAFKLLILTFTGVEGYPGIYTKVSEYMDWIKSTIKA